MSKIAKVAQKVPLLIKKIQKRDGLIVDFDIDRVTSAVHKAMIATGEGSEKEAEYISRKVYSELLRVNKLVKNFLPTVEGIQDFVETQLITEDYAKTAKAYILYREERSRLRREVGEVPEKVRKLSEESKKYFRNVLGEFIYYRTYSRWIEGEGRRETWVETVDRYVDFMRENLGKKLKEEEYKEIREAILKQEAMPSMRLFQFAGLAARKTNICAYNCSFIAPTTWQDFGEVMYILMCGTGAGYAVENQNIDKLPSIKYQTGKKASKHVIADSKEGWADALVLGMKTWSEGKDIDFDYSALRPAGARLKTMGGKSSGPDPIRSVIDFTRERMLKKQGRKLSPLDAHDILCKIGECVVAGGVRRSAMISLSDLGDVEMRDSKKGPFYYTDPQRALANNSAVYIDKPTTEEFLDEWVALMKSKSGERGIFNRGSLAKTLPERRLKFMDQHITNGRMTGPVGTNPCGEIILQSKQFCNLSEVIARPGDTVEKLLKKIRIATIIGTYQSTLTNFPYLSKEWKENCEAERLLGVSVTGQWDCPTARKADVLDKLRAETIKVNQQYAKRFGVNPSTAITAVKPSGNLSQTVDSSSGMHPRFAPFYIRRVRIASTDALFKMLKDQGVPYHPEVGQTADTATTFVIDFPVRAPKGSIFKNDLTAIDQLEYWKMYKEHYTEHNPSTTISVGDTEWIDVGHWVYKNWNIVGGLSFLPRDNHVYQLAPYEEIDEKKYIELSKRWEHIDFSKIVTYEKVDETENKAELACVAGVCEI
ncbi:MAG: ATP cone domain-containing protein [Candidatus Paceibacterota bacterium]|jgi:ribonucleoside-diphosphate reductase alpha chain